MNTIESSPIFTDWPELGHKPKLPVASVTAKVFEDLPSSLKKPVLQRRMSVPDLQKYEPIKTMIEKKHGQLWKCVDQAHDRYGGYLYSFRIRGKYVSPTNVRKKFLEIYPAVEPPITDDRHFISEDLGIKYTPGENLIIFPDDKAFLARWEILRERHPDWDLGPLTIATQIGIANDNKYIEMYCTHDFLLSMTGEFIHDWSDHILENLKIILNQGYKRFRQLRNAPIREIFRVYHTLMKARTSLATYKEKKILITCLSACIDLLSSNLIFENISAFPNILDNPHHSLFFQRRYPNENLNLKRFKAIWDTIQNNGKRKHEEIERVSDQP